MDMLLDPNGTSNQNDNDNGNESNSQSKVGNGNGNGNAAKYSKKDNRDDDSDSESGGNINWSQEIVEDKHVEDELIILDRPYYIRYYPRKSDDFEKIKPSRHKLGHMLDGKGQLTYPP